MVARNRLADFKKVLLPSTLEVVDEETARVPVVLSFVKYLELDEGGLPGLDCRSVLVLQTAFLFRNVLCMCQVFDRRTFILGKHA